MHYGQAQVLFHVPSVVTLILLGGLLAGTSLVPSWLFGEAAGGSVVRPAAALSGLALHHEGEGPGSAGRCRPEASTAGFLETRFGGAGREGTGGRS